MDPAPSSAPASPSAAAAPAPAAAAASAAAPADAAAAALAPAAAPASPSLTFAGSSAFTPSSTSPSAQARSLFALGLGPAPAAAPAAAASTSASEADSDALPSDDPSLASTASSIADAESDDTSVAEARAKLDAFLAAAAQSDPELGVNVKAAMEAMRGRQAAGAGSSDDNLYDNDAPSAAQADERGVAEVQEFIRRQEADAAARRKQIAAANKAARKAEFDAKVAARQAERRRQGMVAEAEEDEEEAAAAGMDPRTMAAVQAQMEAIRAARMGGAAGGAGAAGMDLRGRGLDPLDSETGLTEGEELEAEDDAAEEEESLPERPGFLAWVQRKLGSTFSIKATTKAQIRWGATRVLGVASNVAVTVVTASLVLLPPLMILDTIERNRLQEQVRQEMAGSMSPFYPYITSGHPLPQPFHEAAREADYFTTQAMLKADQALQRKMNL